jgi:hypothetical protein
MKNVETLVRLEIEKAAKFNTRSCPVMPVIRGNEGWDKETFETLNRALIDKTGHAAYQGTFHIAGEPPASGWN